MTVYADVLFIVNFSLDFVTLYITGRLMSLSTGVVRMCLSAALGAAFAVSALILDMDGIVYAASSVAVCAFMCLCAYRGAGVFGYIGASVLLFSVGSALGGAMTALSSLAAGYRDSLSDDGEGGVLVIAVAVTAAALTAAAGRITQRRCFVGKRGVTVINGGRSRTLSALCDSGSLLREPLSGRPALIVRADAVSDLIPPAVIAAATAEDPALAAEELPPGILGRVRLLPVSSVTGDGLMLGYRPDLVTVERGKRKRTVDCILAISCAGDGFGGCDAVIPAELI